MIRFVEVKNFGPISRLTWESPRNVNLILGANASGKTFLLKGMYTAMKVIEDHGRGDSKQDASLLLAERLYWTYQTEKIGDMVSKRSKGPLEFKMRADGQEFAYGFGPETEKKINISSELTPREHNSIFFPAKEVLSLQHIIKLISDKYKLFGFDATYVDLVNALQFPTLMGKNFAAFSKARKCLANEIINGKVEFDNKTNTWIYKQGNIKYSIGMISEGVKKIAILDTLLGNRYLNNHSIIFIDEPESGLHPGALVKYLDIIAQLAEVGIQFFMASHSYTVVKKLYLLAKTRKLGVSILSWEKDPQQQEPRWYESDLKDGLPNNSIINESIKLYDEEMDIAFSC